MARFTIGHSNHSIEVFFALLEEQQIGLLIDVRTSPRTASSIESHSWHGAVPSIATWERTSVAAPAVLFS
ncbi:MAG: hypothetical protein ACYCX3_12600 [Thermoleophilia bacterium]